jgi:uncharacterized lipoprotein YddW (UPF0748 family)
MERSLFEDRVGIPRRRFLEVIGGAAAVAAMSRPAVAGPAEAEFRAWTWFHGDDRVGADAWRRRMARIRAAGISGVLVEGGDTALHARAAREEGLEFHRWIFTMYRSGDRGAKRNHPDWFSVSRNGDSSLTKPPYVPSYNWFCPAREPVREYLRGIVDRIAARPEVAGVHLDYIRFIDVILPRGLWARYDLVQDHEMAQFDFCYCDVCREKFRRQSGVDPFRLRDPAADEAWRRFRWDQVTELVDLLSRAVRARGKQTTAAVFATPALARRLVRQAWETWPIDAVFPMLYHNFYLEDVSWIGRAAREGVAALPRTVPLYAGLFVPRLSPAELGRAIDGAREAGAAGVSLFSLPRLQDAHLRVLRQAISS